MVVTQNFVFEFEKIRRSEDGIKKMQTIFRISTPELKSHFFFAHPDSECQNWIFFLHEQSRPEQHHVFAALGVGIVPTGRGDTKIRFRKFVSAPAGEPKIVFCS